MVMPEFLNLNDENVSDLLLILVSSGAGIVLKILDILLLYMQRRRELKEITDEATTESAGD